MFITLEGPEGSGKTSHIPYLVEYLRGCSSIAAEAGWLCTSAYMAGRSEMSAMFDTDS